MEPTSSHAEQWKPIPAWEGLYEASTHGRIRSVARKVMRSNGVPQTIRARILKQSPMGVRRFAVRLYGPKGRKELSMVHHLILETFVGPRPPGSLARHLNDDPCDNRPENLRWGNKQENARDAVANGLNRNSNKTICKRGHPLTADNVYVRKARPGGMRRECRQCSIARVNAWKKAKSADKNSKEAS